MSGMTAADRAGLIKVLHGRARLAKSEVIEREKTLQVEIEEQLTAEFNLRDEVRSEVRQMAEEALRKVNEEIRQQAALMGYGSRYVPQAALPYHYSYDTSSDEEKQKRRKLAATRLAAMRAAANKAIDAEALRAEEALIIGGLESDEARAMAHSLPAAEQLMPPLSLADLGVKTWQPARDAAKELLAIPSGADRRRKIIIRAIAQNPGASDRKIAQITGLDHKTVAKYRAEEVLAISGKAAEQSGEIPTDDGGQK
jgi:hypothetical protein